MDSDEGSGGRIATTHVGSLPRPDGLAGLLADRELGEPYDLDELGAAARDAVADVVARQVEIGIDAVSDGEMSKISYSTYVKDRLSGFDGDTPRRPALDLALYPDLRARMAAANGGAQSFKRQSCVGPVAYTGQQELAADLANFAAACQASSPRSAFLNAASPGLVTAFQPNQHYPSHEDYVAAIAEAMQKEYEAIVDAGFLLQLDCPDLAMAHHTGFQSLPEEEFLARAQLHVEVLNHATRNIDPARMRMHLCWGNYEGPHDHDIPLATILPIVLRARPSTILFEAANPRHSHEWEVWAEAKVPDDKILAPGVITSTTNYIDHPRRVAQLLRPYLDLVGPERVIASTDCGFGTFAGIGRIEPDVAYRKLANLVEGAAIAERELSRPGGGDTGEAVATTSSTSTTTSGTTTTGTTTSGADTAEVERACRRLVLDSAAHNDSNDWSALATLYADDATLLRPSGDVVAGREAIEAAYRAGPTDRVTRHVCTNIRIVPESATTATGTTTVLRYAWQADDSDADDGQLPAVAAPGLGEFIDTFTLASEGWRISARQARLIARPAD